MFRKYGFCLLLWMSAVGALAQVQSGVYPYGSFDTAGIDSIDRGSLNVHFSIPVVTKQGRGIGFQYSLVYDSLVWTPVGSAGAQMWMPTVGFGLHGQLNEGFEGYLSYNSGTTKCYASGSSPTNVLRITNYVYHDQFGVSHPFKYNYDYCQDVASGGGASPDGSGYSFSGGNVTTANGTQISAPANSQTASGSITDANGNYISNNGNGTFTDTLGKTALTISGSGTPGSARVFTYSTPAGPASVTVTYKAYQVQTNFACGVTDYNLPQNLVDTITLADGSEYKFGYEQTPGYKANVTGRLAQLTLPQGGVVTYTYTGANSGIICADGTPAGLTRSGGVNRTYVRSSVTAASSHTAVTDGLGNTSAYDFVIAGAPEAFYETNRSVNQGSSTLLLARQTCYNNSGHPCTTTAVGLPITQIDTYETLNGTQQHGYTLTYNSFGLLTSRSDYDFNGASRATAPMRKETWAYPTTGIVNLVSSDSVVDGQGNSIGSTSYLYDETTGSGHAALVATSGLPHHNPVSGQRGNLTTVSQASGTGGKVYTASAYEDTGNPVSTSAPSNSTTYAGFSTYAYDSATHAFTTTATPATPSSGVPLPTSATNDANSGALLTSVDPNGQITTYASYDPRLRPTEIDYPDTGKTVTNYTPSGMGMYQYMNATTHTNIEASMTPYGQLNWVAMQNGPQGAYYWNYYCYDGNGNLQYAAYRFSAANLNNTSCSGAGDSYTYDALGRVAKITHADNSAVTYSYNGRANQVTDENGVSRVTQVDGLGRPTAVCEISGTTLYGVAAASCPKVDIAASGFQTTYTYSTDTGAQNALQVAITQGMQTRKFETDWLGRSTSVAQPESGTTTYGFAYSTSKGLGLTVTRTRPMANQTAGTPTTTTTQYDTLGRVVSVNYSDGLTPNRAFAYDVDTSWPQATSYNLKGRLATTSGGSGATLNSSAFTYDAMGRVLALWQCAPSTCGTSNQAGRPLFFGWDWLGNLIQESDGASGTINYGRSIAGEVTSITNATYTNLPYNPPNLVSNVVNGPDGPISYTLGNGLNVFRSYDQLGRPNGQWVCNSPATLYCSGGTQVYGTNGTWKGSQLQSQADSVLGQQISYGYTDGFNRLTSRTVTSGTAQNYSYKYDLYGNRVSQTPANGGYSFNPVVNAVNNHISGYTYDAAGNVTNDSVNTYTYDAEGNVTKVVSAGGTSQYVYDVFNHRIRTQTPSATTEYTYDYAGRRISNWLLPGNSTPEGKIYWDGQLLGFRSLDGTTYFEHHDLTGTERLRSSYAGTVGSSNVSLPWGDGYVATLSRSGSDQDNNHFADLEHDPESNTEHAQFRNYSSTQGRWLAPDPYLGSYDLTNPQSFNRYAYALNNPTSFVDPSGLDYSPDPCATNENGVPVFCVGTEPGNPEPCTYDPFFCSGLGDYCYLNPAICPDPGHPGVPRNPGGGGGGSSTPGYGPAHLALLSTLVCYQGGCILPGAPPFPPPTCSGLKVAAAGAGFVAATARLIALFPPAAPVAGPTSVISGFVAATLALLGTAQIGCTH